MAEHIKATVYGHIARHVLHIQRVNDGQLGFDAAQANARLAALLGNVNDGNAGRFAARPGSCWHLNIDGNNWFLCPDTHGNQWKHGFRRNQPLPERLLNKVKKFRFRIVGVKRGRLRIFNLTAQLTR